MTKEESVKGSIYLEVLITLAMVGVATLTLILAMLTGVQITTRGNHLTLASEIARNELETIRHLPADNFPLQENGPLIGEPTPPLSVLPAGTASLSIREYQGNPELKEVQVTVTYQESGNQKAATLTTLIGSGGINE